MLFNHIFLIFLSSLHLKKSPANDKSFPSSCASQHDQNITTSLSLHSLTGTHFEQILRIKFLKYAVQNLTTHHLQSVCNHQVCLLMDSVHATHCYMHTSVMHVWKWNSLNCQKTLVGQRSVCCNTERTSCSPPTSDQVHSPGFKIGTLCSVDGVNFSNAERKWCSVRWRQSVLLAATQQYVEATQNLNSEQFNISTNISIYTQMHNYCSFFASAVSNLIPNQVYKISGYHQSPASYNISHVSAKKGSL